MLVEVASLPALAEGSGLVVRAAGAWREGDVLPGLPGFIESPFSPMVAEAAERCLRLAYCGPEGKPETTTAIVIASTLGDVASATAVARAVATGGRVGPLLFFQAVPNAVAGHVAARWGLAGPVVCVASPRAGAEVAALLIADGDAAEALIVHCDQSADAVLVEAP